MAIPYYLSNCCGAPFNTGHVAFVPRSNSLAVPSSNLLTIYDLKRNQFRTCPFQANHSVNHVLFSPKDPILIIIDCRGDGLVVNRVNFSVFSYPKFKGKVSAAQFSPNGEYFAVAIQRQVKIYYSPCIETCWQCILLTSSRSHLDKITTLDWSSDSNFICTASRDLTVRLIARCPFPGFYTTTFVNHRYGVKGAFFSQDMARIYTVARDGTLIVYRWHEKKLSAKDDQVAGKKLRPVRVKPRVSTAPPLDTKRRMRKFLPNPSTHQRPVRDVETYTQGYWAVEKKGYCQQPKGVFVQKCRFSATLNLLLVGFSNGSARLYEMPDLNSLYAVNIGKFPLTSVDINHDGEWIALGTSHAEQLVVWEWKTESFILKQQSHTSSSILCVASSPVMNLAAQAKYGGPVSRNALQQNVIVATGGMDGKVKLWDTTSGFNYMTFTEHTAAVNALCFTSQGNAVFSASSDGTIRGHDLARYRNFATLTAPDKSPSNFEHLAIDGSGEFVVASAREMVYVWSIQTKKLLESLHGHQETVSYLAFHPHPDKSGTLISCAHDRLIMVWNIFETVGEGVKSTSLVNHAEVVSGAMDPRGNDVMAVGTVAGNIWFWDIEQGTVLGSIDGLRDIQSGRRDHEVYATTKSSGLTKAEKRKYGSVGSTVNLNQQFTSLAYTSNGLQLLAASVTSARVCMYCTTYFHLLHVYQLTTNQSLMGLTMELNSKYMTKAGAPLSAFDLTDEDEEDEALERQAQILAHQALPGVKTGELRTITNKREEFRTFQIAMSQDGHNWYAATSNGLFIYTAGAKNTLFQLNNQQIDHFDPVLVTKNVTLENIRAALENKLHAKALVLALGLNEFKILRAVYNSIPYEEIPVVAQSIPGFFLPVIFNFIRISLSGAADSPNDGCTSNYLECHLHWLLSLLSLHASALQSSSSPAVLSAAKAADTPEKSPLDHFDTSMTEMRTMALLVLKTIQEIHRLGQILHSNSNILKLLLLSVAKASPPKPIAPASCDSVPVPTHV